jgi:hypothetical protein
MAKIVDGMPRRRPIPSKYDWSEWFDGQARILEPGVDFSISAENFRAAARLAAARRGLGLQTHIADGLVWIQSFRRNER